MARVDRSPAEGEAQGPLASIPIFAGLTPEERVELHALMRVERVPANKTIFWFGDPGDSFYLIHHGQVVVTVPSERGEHVVLNQLGVGGFFGEISLLDGGTRTASVRAITDTELYVLGRNEFHAFLRRYPEVAIAILGVMGERQRASTVAFRSLTNPNVAFEETRLSAWQRLSDRIASQVASSGFFLAHVLWFVVWLILNFLGRAGIIGPRLAFDPTFTMLTMIVSLEGIFLMIFILVSQNRQAQKDRLQTDLDYQVNVKAQTEILGLSQRLARLEAHLLGEESSTRPAEAEERQPPSRA
jgi:CRP/FNR family transcriptional regulator, cyclic AMP receptor protein